MTGIDQYFAEIESQLDDAFETAEAARERGGDPTTSVEIPVAKDMADRVENILGIPGVADRVRELEATMSREEAALALAEDFADGTVGSYETTAGKIEGAVRTAVALLTEGVVAAPIEGIDRVEVLDNDDGSQFVRVFYAGPIRSAGGTAQALSVLVADYARTLLGLDRYKPRDAEIERYAEELGIYDNETGLQYSPKDKETKFIAEHSPIMLDGEATGDAEVSATRDLERVDTNSPRGGMCLVLGEGIAQKAPKIKRYTTQLDELSWPWLDDLIDGTIGDSSDDADDNGEHATESDDTDTASEESLGPPRADPKEKFLRDLIAGRPVFSHPSRHGGFRLRYGRARNHGFATAGVHPATMHLVDDFLATGTQIKTERPGKAAGVVPVDTIEGPTVRLANGEVRRIDDPEEAIEIRNGVEAVLDLGEYLVNYGEFVENNHPLVPASFTVEWWAQAFERDGGDLQALRDDPHVSIEEPTAEQALSWVNTYDTPLHPAFTYLWHDLTVGQFDHLASSVADGELDGDTVRLDRSEPVTTALETLLVEHIQHDETIEIPDAQPFVRTLGLGASLEKSWSIEELSEQALTWGSESEDDAVHDPPGTNAIKAVNEVAPFTVRERAPTRIGNRMGRPEKSESRELSPAVHTLFPIGEAGGSQRDVSAAASHADSLQSSVGTVDVQIARRECPDCTTRTYEATCPDCETVTVPVYECRDCEIRVEPDESGRAECPRCEALASPVTYQSIDIDEAYHDALASLSERAHGFDILKGVKGLTSEQKVPEPMEKGILRAKHGVSAFKDGTIRYDMTDLPVTAVRPSELSVTVDQFRSLGYEEDIDGEPLEHADQLVELRVQDVVLSMGAAEHLLKTADFVDDLLVRYYDMEPFYELEGRDDLVGELVFGMAPHTSAAVVGRIVGFTTAAVGYAHPYFHAAKRRNCFHPSTTVPYIDGSGDRQRERIDELVESRLESPERDALGTETVELDAPIRVPSLAADGTPTTSAITTVSKHPAPEHLIAIETAAGSTLRLTPDHTLYRGESLAEVQASEIAVGDRLPGAPSTTDSEQASAPSFETVTAVQFVEADVSHTYCCTVEQTHTLLANDVYVGQCDGDEDCVMLLMDGLLNFSKLYLPDKRGGSVVADAELCAIDADGTPKTLSFDSFWNELDCPIEYDGKFQKKTCVDEGWTTFAFADDHSASPRPIEKAIRYRVSDEPLLTITTQCGRTLTITENHSLFRYDGAIEAVAGDELSVGELLVAPGAFDIDGEQTTIDLADRLDVPHVVVDDPSGSSTLPLSMVDDGGPSNGGKQGSMEIARRGEDRGIAREFDVDESFGWLCGLLIADDTHEDARTVSVDRQPVRERLETVVDQTLDCALEMDGSSARLPPVVGELLQSLGAHTEIPAVIRTAPEPVIQSFLRGYMSAENGGGQTADQALSLIAPTDAVTNGLVFLCLRLGLVPSIERTDMGFKLTATRPSQPRSGDDPRQLVVTIPDALTTLRETLDDGPQLIDRAAIRGETVALSTLAELVRTLDQRSLEPATQTLLEELRVLTEGDLVYLEITDIERVEYDGYLYDLQVGGEPIFTANWLYAHNSMDAPLVMSSRIDPTEIDDEAHNVDIHGPYPLAFYEATREMADPGDVDITIAEDTLGTDHQYEGFDHTHDTTNIAAGPDLSAYKTLGSMLEKMDAQLALARRLRAVDETDVAERIIEYHFLPDLIGNLRAFASQETRCLDCNTKYRRVPLAGECLDCGGRVALTVHEGSVNKYLDTAIRVADEFGCREYTKQRLEILDRQLESVFENDHNKPSTLGDFM